MKILITGARGFIGNYLLKELIKKGHQVRCLVRKEMDLPESIEQWKGDLTNYKKIRGICDDIDIVFHLAAKAGFEEISMRNYIDFWRVNVLGTKNLLNEAKKAKVKLFVYFSSIAVYGIMKDRINIKNNKYNPKTPYGITKYKAEKLCTYYSKNSGFPVLIIRPSMVYDFNQPERDFKRIVRFINIGIIPVIGNGNNIVNVVERKNLIKEIIEMVKRSEGGTFIINDESITLNKFIEKISKHYKKRVIKFHIPLWIVYLIALITEKMSEIFKFTPFITRYRLKYILAKRDLFDT